MSNPKTISGAVAYLKANPDRGFLTLINTDSNTKIGKDEIYLQDIPAEDLASYIRSNIGMTAGSTKVWIEYRIKYGASSKKEGTAFLIEVLPTAPTQTVQAVSAVPAVQVQHPAPTEFASPSWLGSPNMGLGVAQIIDLHGKANRLADKEEMLSDLKKEHADLKAKYNALDVEKRGLDTKLSISEAQKEMAVMLAKAENKSIFDSPAFTQLMEKAPSLFMAYKGIPPADFPAGLGAAADLSAPKQDLIDHIAENCTDDQANFLGSVAHFLNNPSFMSDLKELILKYSNNGN